MANLFTKLLHFFDDDKAHEEGTALKTQIIEAKNADIKELRKINKSVKLLLEEGSIEIVIRNVSGVIKEDYCRRRKK
jgi:hypothetical protein